MAVKKRKMLMLEASTQPYKEPEKHGKDSTTKTEEIEDKNNHEKSDGDNAGRGEDD